MAVYLLKEMEKLRIRLDSLSTRVEERVIDAVEALENRDGELAGVIIKADKEIDEIELVVEDECIRILALFQPVAVDLRFVNSSVKINKDLERIGDLAVKSAWQAKDLSVKERIEADINLRALTAKVLVMLRRSLKALTNLDSESAYSVCELEDEIDDLTKTIQDNIKKLLYKHPEWSEQLMMLYKASECFERIADLANNIAREIIYIVEGKVVRHNKGVTKKESKNRFKP